MMLAKTSRSRLPHANEPAINIKQRDEPMIMQTSPYLAL